MYILLSQYTQQPCMVYIIVTVYSTTMYGIYYCDSILKNVTLYLNLVLCDVFSSLDLIIVS